VPVAKTVIWASRSTVVRARQPTRGEAGSDGMLTCRLVTSSTSRKTRILRVDDASQRSLNGKLKLTAERCPADHQVLVSLT
jgi:hypothetical protein